MLLWRKGQEAGAVQLKNEMKSIVVGSGLGARPGRQAAETRRQERGAVGPQQPGRRLRARVQAPLSTISRLEESEQSIALFRGHRGEDRRWRWESDDERIYTEELGRDLRRAPAHPPFRDISSRYWLSFIAPALNDSMPVCTSGLAMNRA